jgi:hypothetical protein
VHHRCLVVRETKLVDNTGRLDLKIMLCTALYILPQNCYKVITFGGTLHVEETKSVHVFMNDRVEPNTTVWLQVQLLGATDASNPRPTASIGALKRFTL